MEIAQIINPFTLQIKADNLLVYADNEAAIALYTKFGFVTEGVMQHYAFRAGQYADIQIMARLSHH
ncbi:hypothetical protein [Egbenema bharatensis]|uniref:hypothetical protein n=1 Tax=Egbenema bharatensis TaxID=3463334 RepID=UPI003A8931C2